MAAASGEIRRKESPREEFPRLIKSLLEKSGMSYHRISEKASIPASTIHGIVTGQSIPRRETLERLLPVLQTSPRQHGQIMRMWEEAMAARPAGRPRPHSNDGLFVHNDGGTVYVTPQGPGNGPPARRSPALVPDIDGHRLKPDPLTAVTLEELVQLMRDFRAWAGNPSARDLAIQSGGEFSHATINKLLSAKPGAKPPLKLGYLLGFIRACGGDNEEQKRWVTAWRVIDQGRMTPGPPPPDNVITMRPSTRDVS